MRSLVAGVLTLGAIATPAAQQRTMQPEDLFRIERIGAIAWTPDRTLAAVEVHRPGRWLGSQIPTADIAVVNAGSGVLTFISRPSSDIIGFFGPAWSPDSRRLLILSVDAAANIRPWLWAPDVGLKMLAGLELA